LPWWKPGGLGPPPAAGLVLPPPVDSAWPARLRRAAVWLFLVAVLLVLFRFDLALMRWRFLLFPREITGPLKQTLGSLREFGQVLVMIVAGVIAFRVDRRRGHVIAALVVAQLLGLLVCYPIKWTASRYRPTALIDEVARPRFDPGAGRDGAVGDGAEQAGRREISNAELLAGLSPADSWRVPAGPRSSAHESFPSGHSTAAFAFAAILAWFYPRLRGLFWFLAAGCALSRYLDAVHWPSDCLAGAMIGYACGWMALRPYLWLGPWSRPRAGTVENPRVPRGDAGVRPPG
jgi:membrane-associated phospholipid phosphatase